MYSNERDSDNGKNKQYKETKKNLWILVGITGGLFVLFGIISLVHKAAIDSKTKTMCVIEAKDKGAYLCCSTFCNSQVCDSCGQNERCETRMADQRPGPCCGPPKCCLEVCDTCCDTCYDICCETCCDTETGICEDCNCHNCNPHDCNCHSCRCRCALTVTHLCSVDCPNCYTPVVLGRYKIQNGQVHKYRHTFSCGRDPNCANEFLARFPAVQSIGNSTDTAEGVSCWYEAQNPGEPVYENKYATGLFITTFICGGLFIALVLVICILSLYQWCTRPTLLTPQPPSDFSPKTTSADPPSYNQATRDLNSNSYIPPPYTTHEVRPQNDTEYKENHEPSEIPETKPSAPLYSESPEYVNPTAPIPHTTTTYVTMHHPTPIRPVYPTTVYPTTMNPSAVKIQSVYRGHRARSNRNIGPSIETTTTGAIRVNTGSVHSTGYTHSTGVVRHTGVVHYK